MFLVLVFVMHMSGHHGVSTDCEMGRRIVLEDSFPGNTDCMCYVTVLFRDMTDCMCYVLA